MDFLNDPQETLDSIVHAVTHGHIAVLESTLKADGSKVNVLVAVVDAPSGDGRNIYPLAMLFNQSPFDLINPPEDSVVETAADRSAAEATSVQLH